MNRKVLIAGLVLACHVREARADEELTSAPSERRISLVVAAEIEYVDVEGAGGFRSRQPSVINPRVRAPYVELDKATLTGGLQLDPRLRATVELRADRATARMDRLFLDATLLDTPCWTIVAQLGRQKPMERPGPRHVETYSPPDNLFWRGREWHLGASATHHHGELELNAVASVAMQRDLGVKPVGEDLALPSIAFIDGDVREGSAVEVGGLLGVRFRGAHAAAFGFRGALLDDSGYVRLEQAFTGDYDAGVRTARPHAGDHRERGRGQPDLAALELPGVSGADRCT